MIENLKFSPTVENIFFHRSEIVKESKTLIDFRVFDEILLTLLLTFIL